MKLYRYSIILSSALLCVVVSSCRETAPVYYEMELQQPNVAAVLWNPADYDFEKGNAAILSKYDAMEVTWFDRNGDGWYHMSGETRIPCDDVRTAQQGYWDTAMEAYWARYDKEYASKDDPHVDGNTFWETSHTVVYDIENKIGYLYPFENSHSIDGTPVELRLPE